MNLAGTFTGADLKNKFNILYTAQGKGQTSNPSFPLLSFPLSLQWLLTLTQSNFDKRPIDFSFPTNPQFFCAKPKEAKAQISPV